MPEKEAVMELDERDHLRGCPANPSRLEWEEHTATAGEHEGHRIEIIRCVDCGGFTVNRLD